MPDLENTVKKLQEAVERSERRSSEAIEKLTAAAERAPTLTESRAATKARMKAYHEGTDPDAIRRKRRNKEEADDAA